MMPAPEQITERVINNERMVYLLNFSDFLPYNSISNN